MLTLMFVKRLSSLVMYSLFLIYFELPQPVYTAITKFNRMCVITADSKLQGDEVTNIYVSFICAGKPYDL